MKNHSPIFFVIAGWILLSLEFAAAEPVDPCNPEEWRAMQKAEFPELPGWLPNRIRQLEEERTELLGKILQLPQHAPVRLPERLGYHSIPLNGAASTAGESNHVVEVRLKLDPRLGAIAFAPALVPGEKGSYAFPKRFKIEVMDRKPYRKNKQWIIPPPPYEWVEVVNWMDEDFPDPGPYPVFFNMEDQRAHRLRLTVAGGEAGLDADYHALGEMYLFEKKGRPRRLEENMMGWRYTSINISRAMHKPPVWGRDYLNDGISGLGLPLSEEVFDAEDFMVSWAVGSRGDEPVQIVLDLGEERQAGFIQLWPAEAPHGMSIPLFGFPWKITMELSSHIDFSEPVVYAKVREWLHHDNLLRIHAGGRKIRYIRLTLEDLAEYKGETILGLGEIMVTGVGESNLMVRAVSASGLPQEGLDQLPRLVDGFSRKRRILREPDWVRGLAMRRPLDRRLAEVEQELVRAKDAWTAFKLRASIWGGGLLGLGLLSVMGLQRLQRRKVLKNLKTRIMRDLHDDVGGGLGGIALKSGVLEGMVSDETVKRELGDVTLMARETGASLREVVWMLDQERILLSALLDKLVERAERVLQGVQLSVERSSEVPELEVSLNCKRHLIMFFKEAVHNCARHAEATHVAVSIQVEKDRSLRVSVQDDGCGFDPTVKSGGLGLGNMKKRAEELHGELELRSVPGEGTYIELTLSLEVLSREPTKAYKTSN
jgi:signal transduction histidine kinase